MNIGQVAEKSGLSAKTIRYYEDIGLITPTRDTNGYRDFDANDAHMLTFLGRARALGFTIQECRALLQLYEDSNRASADVKRIALQHLDKIGAKIADLQTMQSTLTHLVETCAGNDRPECPILNDLGRGR